MESKFIVGDYVWAKMKGFPAWPAKVVESKQECKKPVAKKPLAFVYFYYSNNYAWISDDLIYEYKLTFDKNSNPSNRLPKGFKDAIDIINKEYTDSPPSSLPSERTKDNDISSSEKKEASQKKKLNDKKKKKVLKIKLKMQDTKSSQEFTAAYKTSAPPHRKRIVSDYESDNSQASSSSTTNKRGRLVSNRKAFMNKSMGSPVNPILAAFQNQSNHFNANDFKNADTIIISDPKETVKKLDASVTKKDVFIASPYKIGFLGLGVMGQGIVSNLLSTGHEVTVWNRTPSCCREFIANGAFKGLTPADVVDSCDITFSCVSDANALLEIVTGEHGVLKSIRPGKFYVDITTVSPETVCHIHELISRKGGSFLECPVLGTKEQAYNGKLIMLAGGDYDLYAKCHNIFEAMSTFQHYCGEAGSAAKMNLVIKMFTNTVLAGLAESVSLADGIGLDTTLLMKIMSFSGVNSPLVEAKGKAMVEGLYNNPEYRLCLAQKDMKLAVNLSEAVDCPLHVASSVNELYKKAKAKGYGEHDVAAIYRSSDI